MKTIGLLGGMSWESSVHYERIINQEVRRRLGGTASADLIIRSYNFAAVEQLQAEGRWEDAGRMLATDARALQDAGAALIVLCTNTMHRVAPAIEAAIDVPFLHLADATARAVRADGINTVGLLGTRFTMEHDFYRGRLEGHGLKVVVPDDQGRTVIHNVIYQELVRGEINPESKQAYLDVISRMTTAGAEGVIAGCTEIELLVGSDDVDVAYYPTTRLHALAAVDAALDETEQTAQDRDRHGDGDGGQGSNLGLLTRLRDIVGPAGVLVGTDAAPMLVDWRKAYRGDALAVVRPRSTEQVAKVMSTAAELDAVVVTQGGNTGLSGGATPLPTAPAVDTLARLDDRPCIVVSTTAMNGIVDLDVHGWTMTVEAGVTIQAMQEAAAAVGRRFGPDWGARGTATIGGAIATNAGGMNVVRYGTMRSQILGLEVVLADGRVWNGLRALAKDSTGYDLKHLFIGSEGTLGVVTRAVVRLHPPAHHRATALVALDDIDRLMALFALTRTTAGGTVTAFELMPEAGVARICELHQVSHPFGLAPVGSGQYCLITLESDRPVDDTLTRLLTLATEQGLLADAMVAGTPAQDDQLWFIRDHMPATMLYPLHGHGMKMDVAVPIGNLARFHSAVRNIVSELTPDALVHAFGHVGDGNLHVYVLPGDESAVEGLQKVKAELTARIDAATIAMGGTLSAEHGIGQELRTRVEPQKPPIEWKLMGCVKDQFDPDHRLNPGKMLPG